MKSLRFLVVGLVCLYSAGCRNLYETSALSSLFPAENAAEQHAVEEFLTALKAEDLDKLKEASSERFAQEALRHPDAVADLKLMKLPTGMVEVLQVEEVSETEKRVSTALGESKHKLLVVLTREPDAKQWDVDDMFIRQKRGSVTATRSVTEQMDLLLTVREFLEAAKAGDRRKILAATTDDFRKTLEPVQGPAFERIREKIAGKESLNRLKPDAQFDGEIAAVRYDRLSGELLLSLKYSDSGWRVDDVAVESPDDKDHIPSVRKTAQVIKSGVDFFNAYQAGDKAALQMLVAPRFYENALSDADFASFPLPVAELLESDYTIKAVGKIATILVNADDSVVTLSLQRADHEDDPERPGQYLVTEVTHFEGNQQMLMSAVFTAQSRMAVFADALQKRNLPILKRLSTPDFVAKVWDQVDQPLADALPIAIAGVGTPQTASANYHSDVSEFRVRQGDVFVTYRLRDWNGEQLIDDVLLEQAVGPASLKETLSVLIPVRRFVAGLDGSSVEQVRKSVSSDFNSLVWQHLNFVPPSARVAAAYCDQPVQKIDLLGERAVIQLGGGMREARLRMAREREVWVIDDVELVSNGPVRETAAMKRTLRMQMASGEIQPPRRVQSPATMPRTSAIQPVGYEQFPQPGTQGPAAPRSANPYGKALPAAEPQYAPRELNLDQLPALSVPSDSAAVPGMPPAPPTTEAQDAVPLGAAPQEPIPAYGESPLRRYRTKKISPMSPVWKQ